MLFRSVSQSRYQENIITLDTLLQRLYEGEIVDNPEEEKEAIEGTEPVDNPEEETQEMIVEEGVEQ